MYAEALTSARPSAITVRSAVAIAVEGIRSQAPDGRDDLVRRVLLDVVAGALQPDRAVVREQRLPAPQLARPERGIAGGPHQQRAAVAHARQVLLDLAEEWPAG